MAWGKGWHSHTPATEPDAALSAPVETRLDQLEFVLVSATVFLSPMNFLRHPSYYLTLGDIFAFACLFVALLNGTLPLRPFGSGTLFWMLGIILLIGGLLISSLVNGSAFRGLIVSAQYLMAYFVLPLIILSRPQRQVVFLIKIFVISIFLLSLHGIYLIHIDGQTNTRFVTGSGRLRSFVERTNECASLIALTLPLLLWLGGTGFVRSMVTWICFPFLCYGILLTGSATGLLAMSYACFIYFLMTAFSSWRRFAVSLAGAMIFIAAFFVLGGSWGKALLPAVFQERVLGAIQSGDIGKAGTFTDRYHLIVEAQEMINNAIFLGLGADQHRVVNQSKQPVHNAYLLIWSEGGLIALVGFLFFLLAALWPLPDALRRRGAWLTAACSFSTVSLFAILVNAVPHIYGRFWTVPVLLAVAACICYTREGPISRRLVG